MKAKILFFIIFFLKFIILKSQVYIDFIERIQNYKETVQLTLSNIMDNDLAYKDIDTSTFNIKTYMAMYPAIEIGRKGIVFDYYYYDNVLDGKPYIYVKNKKFNLIKYVNQMADERSLKGNERLNFTLRSLHWFLLDPKYSAKNNVYPINTEEGYFQYLYFYEFGEQFAVKWHANYERKHVIITKQEINKILEQYFEQMQYTDSMMNESVEEIVYCDTVTLQSFLLTDSIVSIQFNTDAVRIKWLEFENWRGLFERTYKILRTKPYHVELINEKHVVKIQRSYLY